MIASLYLLVHELRPAVDAPRGRPRELPVHVHQGPDVLAGDAEHRVDHRGRRAAADRASPSSRRGCSRDRSEASRLYRTFFFLPTMAPAGRGGARVRLPVQPGDRADQPDLRGIGIDEPAAVVLRRVWSKWGLVFLSLWGVGQAMIIFLAGLLDVPRQLYEAAEIEGASALAAVPLRHAADDLAGHLLLARDRRDRRVPVLHAGLRRELSCLASHR